MQEVGLKPTFHNNVVVSIIKVFLQISHKAVVGTVIQNVVPFVRNSRAELLLALARGILF